MKTTMDVEKIILDIKKLQVGTDPQTGLVVDDTILKSHYNQALLESIVILLEELQFLKKTNKPIGRKIKEEYQLSDNQKKSIILSKEPISISKFAYLLNAPIDHSVMKKIRATQITDWLLKNNYLYISNSEVNKLPTEKGNKLGINAEIRKNDSFSYSVCLYNNSAQTYILDNINTIINDESR